MRRVGFVVLVAGVMALSGCSGGESSTPEAPASSEHSQHAESSTSAAPSSAEEQKVRADFTIEKGHRTKGPETVEAKVGQSVALTITSDTADEVHVHGVNVSAKLKPGEKALLEFDVPYAGVFEIELHGAHGAITELKVTE